MVSKALSDVVDSCLQEVVEDENGGGAARDAIDDREKPRMLLLRGVRRWRSRAVSGGTADMRRSCNVTLRLRVAIGIFLMGKECKQFVTFCQYEECQRNN